MNEIETRYYFLSAIKKYNIPSEEVEITRQNLKYYLSKKQEMIEEGEWYD